jgi:predicted enzyme related to lactoylglutathione lyase
MPDLNTARFEKTERRLRPSIAVDLSVQTKEKTMIRIANAQLWVHDQDEALAFYTEKVGMEVRADVTLAEMGDFRWLTVGPPGQEDVSIVLMAIPGPPVMDEETGGQVRELMAKGFAGTVFLTTDDCQASYEELKARGVEFTEAPEERPYGIDSGFRDPSGNNIRLAEVRMAGV